MKRQKSKVESQKTKVWSQKLKVKVAVLARLLEWSCEKFMCRMQIIHVWLCENHGAIPVIFSQIGK